jgi:hypothetical protein
VHVLLNVTFTIILEISVAKHRVSLNNTIYVVNTTCILGWQMEIIETKIKDKDKIDIMNQAAQVNEIKKKAQWSTIEEIKLLLSPRELID